MTMQEKQEARAHLRKEFLSFLTNISKRSVTIRLLEGDHPFKGVFESCDAETCTLLISSLESGVGKQGMVRIRVADCISLTMSMVGDVGKHD